MFPLLVTRREACKRIGISRTTFDDLRKAGRLPNPWSPTTLYVWPQILEAVTGKAVAIDGDQPADISKGATP